MGGSAQTNREQPFAWLKDSHSVSTSLPIGTPLMDSLKPDESVAKSPNFANFGTFGIAQPNVKQNVVGAFDGSGTVPRGGTPAAISTANAFGARHVPLRHEEWSATVPVYNSHDGNIHKPEL